MSRAGVGGSQPEGRGVNYTGSGAVVDGPYRFALWRTWDGRRKPLGFIMHNPSTADSRADDPTIRRCVRFAIREKAGGIMVVNVVPWRATKPEDLYAAMAAGHDVMRMAENRGYIAKTAHDCSRVVGAWGAGVRWRVGEVKEIIGGTISIYQPNGMFLWCLGVTKGGHPRHPLMVRNDQPIERWTW